MRRVSFRPWDRFYRPPAPPEKHHALTADGLRLALHRVPPASGRGPAVILCHGLSSNHRGFHFPERSLASWLAARGFDCWLPDLRGSGESESPGPGWTLDDHVLRDVPAILEQVQRMNGGERVHWVGHSMGGMLLFCYGITHPDAPIARAVTVASALDYRLGETGYRSLLAWKPLLGKLSELPYGAIVHLLAPLLARVPSPLDAFQISHRNIEPALARRLHAVGFGSVPVSLLLSLATTFDERGLCNGRRTVHYLEQTDRYRIPTRLLAGGADRQVSVEAVRDTARRLGGPVDVVVPGREAGGSEDYGHWDLILGRRAETEVWPAIASWLEAAPA